MIEKTLHITTIAGEMETFICRSARMDWLNPATRY
jgi:hypothetical protein